MDQFKLNYLYLKALGYNVMSYDDFTCDFRIYFPEFDNLIVSENNQIISSSTWTIQVGDKEITNKTLKNIHEHIEKQEARIKEIKELLAVSDEEKKKIIIENFDKVFGGQQYDH